ncbi:hypothetical protein CQA65_13385 [Klebsiella pneumoniae]|nr:hypothetical protein [Klebsiella pneumoniae]PCR07193.1 hypothetical protein CQA72_22445 [Klebsiella pneumoniae]PCR19106.1 hypothetical protein CQA65_13385 [Klebsiella pneumoniae]
MKSPSCRMGFLRFCRPASVPVYLPRWLCAYRGYGSSATCWPRGHQCRKVTDVNRSLLQPAAHTSNSITDTVAPDRPFQSALSP